MASWILPRLTQQPGLVCGSVPDGYAAYARICHPFPGRAGRSLSWREVAELTGAVAHPLMQWHCLIGADGPDDRSSAGWGGASPARGHLDGEVFQQLITVLESHTRTGDDCVCAYWVGYTRARTGTITAVWSGDAADDATGHPASPAPELPARAPHTTGAAEPPDSIDVVHHPGRDYELFTGSLSTTSGDGWSDHSPQLLWPADLTWCVATEIDFDSTLVAGDQALIDDVLSTPGLDSWPVLPTDSLRHDADMLNHDPHPSRCKGHPSQ